MKSFKYIVFPIFLLLTMTLTAEAATAKVTTISTSNNPQVEGYVTSPKSRVGFVISGPSGDKEYGSGAIVPDDNGYWQHKVATNLEDGVEYKLSLDFSEVYFRDVQHNYATYSFKGGEGYNNKDLKISINSERLEFGDEMVIKFYDIGADYYIIGASCKDGINLGGKARPDLCVEGEKIYPSGKGRIEADDFYPTGSLNSAFRLGVNAFKDGKIIKSEHKNFEIFVSSKTDEKDFVNDKVIVEDNKDLSKSQMLNLIADILGKDSDVYKIVALLINLGLIK